MKKATLSSLTIAIVLTALIIFGSHHQAQAAPSVKKIEVTDGGIGSFACSGGEVGGDITAGASVGQMEVTASKITGKVSGTWLIVSGDGEVIAAGDITGGKLKANSFTLSGIETFSGLCVHPPVPIPMPVTFTGQCGEDVVLSFKAEKEEQGIVQTQTAIFRDVSVSCTK
jgi:hypothetical protein